jgi:hypothetical protein
VVIEKYRAAWVDPTDHVVEPQRDSGLRRSRAVYATGFDDLTSVQKDDADVTSGVDEDVEVIVVF